MRPWEKARRLPGTLIVIVATLLVGAAGAQNDAIELRNPYFEWGDVIEEGATYEWSVDVTNNTAEELRLEVILDLFDDDDRPVNRDDQNTPYDLIVITVEPGQTVPVEQQGTIAYDRAAEVVSYRNRHRVLQ